MNKFFTDNQDKFYSVFRIIVGLMFFLHGWMKVSNMLNGNSVPGFDLMTLAMLIEVVGGVFLVIGFKARCTATIAGVEMIVAYFMAHAGSGWSPLANGGEAAVLFLAAFLVLASHGAGKWAVDKE